MLITWFFNSILLTSLQLTKYLPLLNWKIDIRKYGTAFWVTGPGVADGVEKKNRRCGSRWERHFALQLCAFLDKSWTWIYLLLNEQIMTNKECYLYEFTSKAQNYNLPAQYISWSWSNTKKLLLLKGETNIEVGNTFCCLRESVTFSAVYQWPVK